MIKKILIALFAVVAIASLPAHALTKLFYTLRDSDTPNLQDHFKTLKTVSEHASKIDILVPQAYVINDTGLVYKFVNKSLNEAAAKHNIKMMPLVTNENYTASKVDHFLNDAVAQQHAINTLVNICRKNHYYGLQIDFEHIPYKDRNAFTQFFTNAAGALHTVNCKISVAIVPKRHNIPPSKMLLRRDLYWSGAYDQKKLGQASDFVVLMTYNQNGGLTTPGPNASVPLDQLAIKYALQNIPKQKIFLGIPTASNYWVMNPIEKGFNKLRLNFEELPISSMIAHGIGISFSQVMRLKENFHLKWQWDNYAKVHYAVFPFQDFYHYLFVEDADSIAAKIALAQQYQLGGIAVFRLGIEDPNMWQKLS